jgi:methylisocitrate lyase
MTEFGKGPLLPFDQLADLGYRAVLYPLTAFRAAMRAAEQTLRVLRDTGSQVGVLEKMQRRAELYDLLGYTDWERKDLDYFGDPARPAESFGTNGESGPRLGAPSVRE